MLLQDGLYYCVFDSHVKPVGLIISGSAPPPPVSFNIFPIREKWVSSRCPVCKNNTQLVPTRLYLRQNNCVRFTGELCATEPLFSNHLIHEEFPVFVASSRKCLIAQNEQWHKNALSLSLSLTHNFLFYINRKNVDLTQTVALGHSNIRKSGTMAFRLCINRLASTSTRFSKFTVSYSINYNPIYLLYI